MDMPSPAMRALARRLLAAEALGPSAADAPMPEMVRVCEKLRASLIRLAGADGLLSLLRRALVMAQAEFPALRTIEVKPDATITGLDKLAADSKEGAGQAVTALTAHLLALLATFIGEPLTLRLVQESWPDETLTSGPGESTDG